MNYKQFDSIIFDVDGTLWYSCDKVAKIWSRAATEYLNRPVQWSGKLLEGYFGQTMEDIMLGLLPELNNTQRQELARLCFDGENEQLAQDAGVLYEGVEETLRELAKNHRLFIVSNCQKGYIEVLLDVYHLRECFEGWLCWEDTMQSKDKTLQILCGQYGLHTPVYVGDTQGDANACAKAGIPMIFAAYGLGEVQNPEKTIQGFAELKELFS